MGGGNPGKGGPECCPQVFAATPCVVELSSAEGFRRLCATKIAPCGRTDPLFAGLSVLSLSAFSHRLYSVGFFRLWPNYYRVPDSRFVMGGILVMAHYIRFRIFHPFFCIALNIGSNGLFVGSSVFSGRGLVPYSFDQMHLRLGCLACLIHVRDRS